MSKYPYPGATAVAQPAPRARNVVLVHGLFADGSSWSEVDCTITGSGPQCHSCAKSTDSAVDPIEVSTADLLFGSGSIEGALTGNPATGDAALQFSVLTGVAAMIETMPLEKAPEAYAKMM